MSARREAILRASAKAIAERGIRGLRVHDVAEVAGVSPGLLYYHFKDRIGLLEAALIHINDRARDYRSASDVPADSARDRLLHALLGEIQERPDVVENSLAWNEVRACAVYEEALRGPLARTTRAWVSEIADAVSRAQAAGDVVATIDPHRSAVTMTALVEGLSGRWLCGELSADEARALVLDAVGMVMPSPVRRPGPSVMSVTCSEIHTQKEDR
ncbi:TetR/AcrR family transcriptional regulator [Nocardia sp. NPDC058176]|uniref:TetR/AcrR family transcriptional regulator n=1 Tax=Nocardia sp. NPDC058176 TaxID=3346368 RepID=UPI0036DAF223